MLALTRKKGESLIIDNNIEFTILEIRGDQVKIGITAPKQVPIYRKEVYVQIENENKAAVNAKNLEKLKKLENKVVEFGRNGGQMAKNNYNIFWGTFRYTL